MRRLLAGAEPFRFEANGDAGVLLIDGFTGSPFEMRPLGEYLAERGVGSVAPLLGGHGTHPEDLLDCSYRDWLANAEQALEELRARYRSIFLVGLSMGGVIALNVAARHAGDAQVGGVVPLCAPVRLDDWRLGHLNILQHLVRWHAWGKPDVKDISAWDQLVGYRRLRAASIGQVQLLVDETRDLLPSVRQPILVVQAREDHLVPARNAVELVQTVGSLDKQLLWLDNSYHVVTLDHDAPVLNAAVAQFVAAHSGAPEQRVVSRGQGSR